MVDPGKQVPKYCMPDSRKEQLIISKDHFRGRSVRDVHGNSVLRFIHFLVRVMRNADSRTCI